MPDNSISTPDSAYVRQIPLISYICMYLFWGKLVLKYHVCNNESLLVCTPDSEFCTPENVNCTPDIVWQAVDRLVLYCIFVCLT